MYLLRSLAELSRFKKPLSIALGVFDGVHLGHQSVIRESVWRAREIDGEAVILTFHPHPAKILRPEAAPPLLTTEQQDYELFSVSNVDVCVILDFTKELSFCPAVEFLDQIRRSAPRLHTLVVGPNWHFGHHREGNFKLLKSWAAKQKIQAIEVPPLKIKRTTVSSTMIRKQLMAGDIMGANEKLGRPYQIVGRIVHGSRLGTHIGFPTANLDVENELIPALGVYAARALVEGEVFAAAVNIGIRPTVSEIEEIKVEAYLLDFSGDLYGCHMRLDFLSRIRDERRFKDVDDLKNQIALDSHVTRCLAYS